MIGDNAAPACRSLTKAIAGAGPQCCQAAAQATFAGTPMTLKGVAGVVTSRWAVPGSYLAASIDNQLDGLERHSVLEFGWPLWPQVREAGGDRQSVSEDREGQR